MAFRWLTIDGIDEWRELPAQIRKDADAITRAGAERARDRVKAAYPRGETGRLQDGVVLEPLGTTDPDVSGYLVLSKAEYARAYEFGRQIPHRRPRPTFVPITTQERNATINAVVAMLTAKGFTITGGGWG